MKTFDFRINILKKRFDFKRFCKELDYLADLRIENFKLYNDQVGIYKYIIYFSFYKKIPLLNTVLEVDDTSEFEKDYHILDKEFCDKKNLPIRINITKKIFDGSLFEFMSNNFKLIYHFPMDYFTSSLVYSKFNKRYYHIHFFPLFTEKDGQKPDVIHSKHQVINYYDNKISKKAFFNEILDHFRVEDLGFEGGTLVKGRDDELFRDKKNKKINYWHKLAYENYDE